jgi:hypothetical protein
MTGAECADGRVCTPGGGPCESVLDCSGAETCDPNWTGTACTFPAGPECEPGETCTRRFTHSLCDPANGDDDCAPGQICVLACPGPTRLQVALPGEYACVDGAGVPTGDPCDPANGDADCTAIDPVYLCAFIPGAAVSHPFTGDSTPALLGLSSGDTCNASPYDMGWFEGFSVINPTGDPSYDCAMVTVDLCCTDPVKWSMWEFLRSDGPEVCTRINPDFDKSSWTFRAGHGPDCNAEHCCADGNFAATFTLPPGEYAWQIYGEPTCEDTTWVCRDDDECGPGPSCVPNLGPYQGHVTIESCPIAACCIRDTETCVETNRLECEDELNGMWLGPYAVETPAADCGSEPCANGACCLPSMYGPFCNDDEGYDTLAGCHASTGDDGIYVGGVTCRDDPCPVCSFECAANCKEQTSGSFIIQSNITNNVRVADDFRPTSGTISQVCWSPAFTGPDGECSGPPDNWMLSIYPDDGSGVPDDANAVVYRTPIGIEAKVQRGG